MLLRAVEPEDIDSVDWDSIVLKSGYAGYQRTYRQVDLGDPLAFTKVEHGHVFDGRRDIDDILDALGAAAAAPRRTPTRNTSTYGYLN
jgi:hypothetical protein